jgi:hypothetical protein
LGTPILFGRLVNFDHKADYRSIEFEKLMAKNSDLRNRALHVKLNAGLDFGIGLA